MPGSLADEYEEVADEAFEGGHASGSADAGGVSSGGSFDFDAPFLPVRLTPGPEDGHAPN